MLYGRSAITAYWIVNLIDRRIEVYSDPTGLDANPGYRRRADYGEDEQVPLVIDGREIARLQVRDLLP